MESSDGNRYLTECANIKGLKTQKLRDHMSETELFFTSLDELSTCQIAGTDDAKGMTENAKASKKGGSIANDPGMALEAKTRKRVVTGENFLPPGKDKIKRLRD